MSNNDTMQGIIEMEQDMANTIRFPTWQEMLMHLSKEELVDIILAYRQDDKDRNAQTNLQINNN